MTTLSRSETKARRVKRSTHVPRRRAFIDGNKPGSPLKESDPIIGPRVTSSVHQVGTLTKAAGFDIGAAAQDGGPGLDAGGIVAMAALLHGYRRAG